MQKHSDDESLLNELKRRCASVPEEGRRAATRLIRIIRDEDECDEAAAAAGSLLEALELPVSLASE